MGCIMIEWSRVNELRDEVGADDFQEVVDLFLEEVDSVIERLKTDMQVATLEADLHFLKGSALSLGFARFSDLCASGEQKAASQHPESVDLPEVFDAFEQSKAQFLAELSTKTAA